jgi:hydroxymethylglutaryl-CoA synthase
MKVGIDAISVHIPKLYLPLTKEWAKVRAPLHSEGDVEGLVSKLKYGVGVLKMAITDSHEDVATLGAMAARKLLEDQGIDLNDVGHIFLGSETAIDQSKSTASYILGMLEDYFGKKNPKVGCVDYKFACAGATYALESAVNLFKAEATTKPYILVIASDIAKYELCSPGEYTQGAGAVAMLISKNPRLVEIDPLPMSTVTKNERDFFRPNWTPFPVVDGKYSLDVYCETVAEAFDDYRESFCHYYKKSEEEFLSSVDHLLFHLPFPRMAKYAASRILFPLMEKEVYERELDKPNRGELKALIKDFSKSDKFKEMLKSKIGPSLELSKDVGNIYTGSLFLGLVSLIETSLKDGNNLENQKVIFSSYGSGASAKVFSGQFTSNWKDSAKVLNNFKELEDVANGGKRYPISMEDYERLHEAKGVKLSLPEIVLEKILDKVELSDQERESVREAIFSPTLKGVDPERSVHQPENEFAFIKLGSHTSDQIYDIGFRYYQPK